MCRSAQSALENGGTHNNIMELMRGGLKHNFHTERKDITLCLDTCLYNTIGVILKPYCSVCVCVAKFMWEIFCLTGLMALLLDHTKGIITNKLPEHIVIFLCKCVHYLYVD